ncbi:SWIM zinc finger family protein [Paenibacillus sp. HWE-109]|uniref:SWIM zinc finger family protein n=1 Tax=Paenibacillus sp. HWE-109 TaxID=1306526 RepID=UPI001EDD7950|nr:SWIM zinc finger family protein [Paenibacillus sp. HWE-109]UKS24993.1 SWIM zinc finger family protein [Paenibacillus sp. HWE-109]
MSELAIDWNHWTGRIRSYFDSTILERGWKYYRDGVVRAIETEGASVIKARVSGSRSYKVHLDLKAFSKSTCSCPYGATCKHMAAVLFKVAEQEGYDPKELRNPKQTSSKTQFEFDLSSKKAVKLPKETDSCEAWVAYFEKQYANSKIYNAFSLEELYMRAWGQLNKLADDWEPAIRGIYDIQVNLYLMKLCDALMQSKSGMYDFFYNAEYFFAKIAKHSRERLHTALWEINVEKAQTKYPGHLKEIGAYLAGFMDAEAFNSQRKWYDLYKLLWSELLNEKSLVTDELTRLRSIVAARRRESYGHEAAVMALAHFDMMSEEDENAWERVTQECLSIVPSDWFGYLNIFLQEEQGERLLKWLRWLGPEVQKNAAHYASDYLFFWQEASRYMDVEDEYRQAMVTLLPASYRDYSSFLFQKKEYKTWADLCLLLNLTPLQISAGELQLVEKADPRLILPIYHYAAEECIQAKNRDAYREAVKLLKKLAAAYKKLKQTSRFEAYIQYLVQEYSRYRAFQEELQKGKLLP